MSMKWWVCGILLAAQLTACADGRDTEARVRPVVLGTSMGGVPTATLHLELDGRGPVADRETGAELVLLPADVGADCVTGWIAPFLASENTVPVYVDYLVVPEEPAGLVYPMPAVIPTPDTPEDFYFPPLYLLEDGTVVAWFGGTWEFVLWSEDRIEVVLSGGQTCLFDGAYAVPGSCVADAGRIIWDNVGSAFELALEDRGWLGAPTAYVDPRSGRPLCHEITSTPPPDLPTSE